MAYPAKKSNVFGNKEIHWPTNKLSLILELKYYPAHNILLSSFDVFHVKGD